MKYVHTDGTEYEVAELIYAVDQVATHKLDIPMVTRYKLSAAAELIARHERVCEALDKLLRTGLIDGGTRCAECEQHVENTSLRTCEWCSARTALRCEEDPRG